MHKTQKEIIKRLVLQNHQRFSDLTNGYSFEDNVVFHLKQLIKRGFLNKRENLYHLTKKGLEYSGRFSLADLKDREYKTAYVAFICICDGQYLICERISGTLKFYKFPGGKPFFGEPLLEACRRLFKAETSLELSYKAFQYHSIHFKIQLTTKKEVLFDNVLILYTVTLTKSERKMVISQKGSRWFRREEIEGLENKWPEIDIVLNEKERGQIHEYKLVSDYNIPKEDL